MTWATRVRATSSIERSGVVDGSTSQNTRRGALPYARSLSANPSIRRRCSCPRTRRLAGLHRAEPAASSASTGGAGGACFSFRSPPTSAVGRRGGVLSFGGNGAATRRAGRRRLGRKPRFGRRRRFGRRPPRRRLSRDVRRRVLRLIRLPEQLGRSPASARERALRRPRRPRGASRQPDGAGELPPPPPRTPPSRRGRWARFPAARAGARWSPRRWR